MIRHTQQTNDYPVNIVSFIMCLEKKKRRLQHTIMTMFIF